MTPEQSSRQGGMHHGANAAPALSQMQSLGSGAGDAEARTASAASGGVPLQITLQLDHPQQTSGKEPIAQAEARQKEADQGGPKSPEGGVEAGKAVPARVSRRLEARR